MTDDTARPRALHITADKSASGARLDAWLAFHLPDFTRSYIRRRILAGDVTLIESDSENSRPRGKIKPSRKVRAGESWRLTAPPEPVSEMKPENLPLDVLHEDSNIVVINKTAGMVVHPGYGHDSGTLVNALLWHFEREMDFGEEERFRAGIVHRLDRETSGVIICAKTTRALLELQRQFKAREVQKIYAAASVRGPRPAEGRVELPLGRSPKDFTRVIVRTDGEGKAASTSYCTVAESAGGALVAARPKTGRTHQVRVHLKSAGAPLFFDALYGACSRDLKRVEKIAGRKYGFTPRHMLHALQICFTHPTSNRRMTFRAQIPPDMIELWEIIKTADQPDANTAFSGEV